LYGSLQMISQLLHIASLNPVRVSISKWTDNSTWETKSLFYLM